jgi:YidC/Oxa1 family membrane protein insertase
MRLFLGPKVPDLMASYGISDVLEYGWFWWVSIPLSHLLHFLKYNVLFNYGLAIIALTVIVRSCMLPFSLKAARSAALMQQMGPEMKKIAEKYKGDTMKQREAQMELYRKYKFNPLSGCLPMFLQLPIFLGLYRSLSVDIELRQAELIPGVAWASNLAGPDMLFYWGDWSFLPDFIVGEAAGWLGPYFNILPIISVVLLQIHQRLFTPPATDEQTKMTQDMMKYMTIFMGLLFFKVPAGLCIYFITSSLWSIVERQWMPKRPTAPDGSPAPAESKPLVASKPSGNGSTQRARSQKKQKRR